MGINVLISRASGPYFSPAGRSRHRPGSSQTWKRAVVSSAGRCSAFCHVGPARRAKDRLLDRNKPAGFSSHVLDIPPEFVTPAGHDCGFPSLPDAPPPSVSVPCGEGGQEGQQDLRQAEAKHAVFVRVDRCSGQGAPAMAFDSPAAPAIRGRSGSTTTVLPRPGSAPRRRCRSFHCRTPGQQCRVDAATIFGRRR